MKMPTSFKNKMNIFALVKKSAVLIVLILSHQMLFAQEGETEDFNKKFKFKAGVGIFNTRDFNGLSLQNEAEIVLKKWFSVSAIVQMQKKGGNASRYQALEYSPTNIDKFEATLINSNISTVRAGNISSVGGFLFLYPFGQETFRFRFGPGISYNSFEQVTTSFYKEFDEVEIYNYYLRVSNAKKMDIGLAFGFEKDITKTIFVGLNFIGYSGIEEASSFFGVVGFRIN